MEGNYNLEFQASSNILFFINLAKSREIITS